MALAISQTGKEISTEKLLITAVTDAPDPPNQVTSVIMEVYINNDTLAHTLEHLPDFGTDDTFSFEINSIIKDYFASEFLPLTGASQTAIENAIVGLKFYQVSPISGKDTFSYDTFVIVKNMTQDTFEIEEFDLADYDCGDSGSLTSKLLTTAPNPLLVGDKTSFHVSCLTTSYTGTTPKQEWVIERYLNGVVGLVTTEAVDVPVRGITGQVADGKYDISNYRFDFDSSGGYDEVRIYIRDIASPFTVRSETRAYKLRSDCERTMTLSWLNEFGVQDSFTFAGNINRVGKYKDETFKRVRPVNPVSTDVGDLVYSSNYNYQYDIFSDRMPENTVQWVSKILINKRAAIQTEKEIPAQDLNGLLYNWYALNNGTEGDGTVSGGIVNNTQTGWRVPTGNELSFMIIYAGGNPSDGQFRLVDSEYWQNLTGATNSRNFDGVGSGRRNWLGDGSFTDKKISTHFASYTTILSGTKYTTFVLQTYDTGWSNFNANLNLGTSVRLVRDAVGGENDGDIINNAYTGNNGQVYDAVVIDDKVWLKRNLYETKFNDGTDIPNITDDTDWINDTDGAMSNYDNAEISEIKDGKYFPIVIETDKTTLEDKFTPETLFRLKFRLANRRKGLK